MHERAFVLLPLAEIAPDAPVPGHAPLSQLLEQVDRSSVEKLDVA
jgi:2-amino-4-hydroxy-6-hydroxymethyldihydropteridine diphosphokinase